MNHFYKIIFCAYFTTVSLAQAQSVTDTVPPVVVCQDLSVNLMPNRVVSLWASDFLAGISDNTAAPTDLWIAFEKAIGPATVFPIDSATRLPVTSMTFGCAEKGDQSIRLWAKDPAGNVGYCTAVLTVGDALGLCDFPEWDTVHICVREWCNGRPVPGVVGLEGVHPTFPPSVLWEPLVPNNSGCTSIQIPGFFQAFRSLDIAVQGQEEPLRDVNALDLLHIQWHILGTKPLGSPYAIIAADANKSGTITLLDVGELKKLLLGIYMELPNNRSWRFVPADYVFPDPQNPFSQDFSSLGAINDFRQPSVSLYGIKVGNVFCENLSTAPNLALTLPDIALAADETVEIPLRCTETVWANAVEAYLRFDPQEIEVLSTGQGILPGEAAQPYPGAWHWLWLDPEQQQVNPDQTLLTLRIRAKRRVLLRNALHFDAARPSSLFNAQSEERRLVLTFTTVGTNTAAPQDWSAQVSPNPTNGPLFFQLPNQAPREGVQLMLFSAQGTLMQQTTCANGTCYLDTAQLPQGPYWYALRDVNGVWRGKGRVVVFK